MSETNDSVDRLVIRPPDYYWAESCRYVWWTENIVKPRPIAKAIKHELGEDLLAIDCGYAIGSG